MNQEGRSLGGISGSMQSMQSCIERTLIHHPNRMEQGERGCETGFEPTTTLILVPDVSFWQFCGLQQIFKFYSVKHVLTVCGGIHVGKTLSSLRQVQGKASSAREATASRELGYDNTSTLVADFSADSWRLFEMKAFTAKWKWSWLERSIRMCSLLHSASPPPIVVEGEEVIFTTKIPEPLVLSLKW